jgi:hypothetical protein
LSPILVRPVREQLEHDRIIRLLQAKFRRKYEVGMNPGREETAAVGSGPGAMYPDLVLMSQERGHRLQAVIEVETGESVNHLEALAQWSHFARLRAPFYLYVPSGMVEVARQLCDDNQIQVSEIWSYNTIGDEIRFALVHRARETAAAPRERVSARAPAAAPNAGKPKSGSKNGARKASTAAADRKKAGARNGKAARSAKTASAKAARKSKRK